LYPVGTRSWQGYTCMINELEIAHKKILLKECFLFNHLSNEQLDQLVSFAKTKSFANKEIIFHKSDNGKDMYIIVSGKVSLTSSSVEGKELTFGILGQGDIFGEVSLFDNKERTATVTAIEITETLVLDQNNFTQLILQNPNIALKLLSAFATRLRHTDQYFEDTVFRQLPGRLAKKLLHLARDFGKNTSDGTKISIKLSQNDIGKMSSASRESVNKQMRVWEEQGLIKFSKGFITINEQAELEAIAE